MRDDMFKVVVNHPRWGSRHAQAAKLKHTHPDVKSIGHKRHALESAPYTKSLSENLNPLKRFLFKQRGRKWDDVFSEICQTLDTGSTVKMHIREHIEDFIVVRIHVDADGKWLGDGRWGRPQPVKDWWQDLYVDPFDGRVKETAVLRRKLGLPVRRRFVRANYGYPEGPYSDFRRLAKTHVQLQRGGIWYDLRLSKDPACYDAKLRHELLEESWRDHATESGAWRVSSIKQLGKKELKAHGLSNEPAA